MNVRVGDMFVCEDERTVIVEIKDCEYKTYIYHSGRYYEHIYDYLQIKAMMDYSRSGYTYYRVVKQ
jgi:hypothetical protein